LLPGDLVLWCGDCGAVEMVNGDFMTTKPAPGVPIRDLWMKPSHVAYCEHDSSGVSDQKK
jgi:hypothetical protein